MKIVVGIGKSTEQLSVVAVCRDMACEEEAIRAAAQHGPCYSIEFPDDGNHIDFYELDPPAAAVRTEL